MKLVYKLSSHLFVVFSGTPGPPRNLRTPVGKDGQVMAEWEAPEDDGGSTIINYVIEKNSTRTGANWVEVIIPESKETKRILKNIRGGKL